MVSKVEKHKPLKNDKYWLVLKFNIRMNIWAQ